MGTLVVWAVAGELAKLYRYLSVALPSAEASGILVIWILVWLFSLLILSSSAVFFFSASNCYSRFFLASDSFMCSWTIIFCFSS